jgi:hypothetical protein
MADWFSRNQLPILPIMSNVQLQWIPESYDAYHKRNPLWWLPTFVVDVDAEEIFFLHLVTLEQNLFKNSCNGFSTVEPTWKNILQTWDLINVVETHKKARL